MARGLARKKQCILLFCVSGIRPHAAEKVSNAFRVRGRSFGGCIPLPQQPGGPCGGVVVSSGVAYLNARHVMYLSCLRSESKVLAHNIEGALEGRQS